MNHSRRNFLSFLSSLPLVGGFFPATCKALPQPADPEILGWMVEYEYEPGKRSMNFLQTLREDGSPCNWEFYYGRAHQSRAKDSPTAEQVAKQMVKHFIDQYKQYISGQVLADRDLVRRYYNIVKTIQCYPVIKGTVV